MVCDGPAVIVPGEAEKPCVLELMDDGVYEEVEELRLVLGSPQSNSPFGAAIGEQNETLIRIQDDADSKKSFLALSCQWGTEVCLRENLGELRKQPLVSRRLLKPLRTKKTTE